MDAKLQTLLHAYGEPLPTGVPPQPVDEGEARRLAETRAWLDARPACAPDAAVLDLIFRAAAHGAPDTPPQPGARSDRAPVRHVRPVRRAWMAVGLACALALGGFMLTVTPSFTPVSGPLPQASGSRMMAAAPAPIAQPDREVAPTPPAVPATASAPVTATRHAPPVAMAAAPAPTTKAAAPAKPTRAWTSDESDDRLDLAKLRAERLRSRLDSGLWDAPAVTLTPPTGSKGSRFNAVSSQQ